MAKHANRVLGQNYQHQPIVEDNNENDDYYQDDYQNEASNIKKHYAFSYTVKDSQSGDDFSHTQKADNGAVQGSYKVQLPDGRMQIVKYIADDNGYRADVTYEKDGQIIQENATPVAVAQEPQRRIYYKKVKVPVQQNAPVYYPAQLDLNAVKIHSYSTANPPQGNNVQYQIPVQVQVPVQQQYYQDIHIAPGSVHSNGRRTSVYDYDNRVSNVLQVPSNYNLVPIPLNNHVYKRNTDVETAN